MKNKKIFVLKTATMLSIMFSFSASAIMPKTDYVNLGAKMVKNAQDAVNQNEYVILFKNKLDDLAKISGLSIDAKNNQASAKIQKKQTQAATVSQLEQLRAQTPAINACSTISFQKEISDISCETNSYKANLINKRNSISSGKSARIAKAQGQEPNSLEQQKKEIVERLKESSPSLFDREASNDDITIDLVSDESPSSIIPYYLLSSNPDSLVLNAKQKQAMEDYVLLLSPPYSPNEQQESINQINDGNRLEEARIRAKNNLPSEVFLSILSKRISEDDQSPSEMFLLQNLADSQFSFSDFELVNNTNNGTITAPDMVSNGGSSQSVASRISQSSIVVPELVIRNIAAMKAMHIHFELLSYKDSIKQELILATLLANRLKL
jgi:hypothetical protein